MLSETLAVNSYERFLRAEECEEILAAMAAHIASLPPSLASETARSRSVHSVPGLSLSETMRLYEPKGRLEIDPVPPEVAEILDAATKRALPELKRVLPSARSAGAWAYLEYREGQFVTPHIDGGDCPLPGRRHLSGISVMLSEEYEGGEFVVGTSADPRLWDPSVIAQGADASSAWFREIEPTSWTCRPKAGTALLYGTQIIHSTRPVLSGVAKKIIGFISD